MSTTKAITKEEYRDAMASERDYWKQKNWYYHQDIENFLSFLIPPNSSVLEIGCETGDLLNSLDPKRGVGIDISKEMVNIANDKYPNLKFLQMKPEELQIKRKFDYIVISGSVGHMEDVQQVFNRLHQVCHPDTRVIITYYNHLWEPFLKLAERLRLKMPEPLKSWLSPSDLKNLLSLADFDVIKSGQRFIFPKYLPLLSPLFNKYLGHLPLLRKLCLTHYIIARPKPKHLSKRNFSVSVIVTCRNEKGNIEDAVQRIPELGTHTEIIFVEGGSTDGTRQEIKRVINEYKDQRDLKLVVQDGKGKGNAVRCGFEKAQGDILMILDGDLTVPPEDLPKFYEAIAARKGEFVQGSRLVYPMEKQAMRTLNLMGNKFFSMMFSWLLDQRIKDTLCGTKALFKKDYEKIKQGREFFGDFDPFGDFDLIFGASKLNLKIMEIPIRYRERQYGSTNIRRFKHGWLLIKMCVFAMRKIKFI